MGQRAGRRALGGVAAGVALLSGQAAGQAVVDPPNLTFGRSELRLDGYLRTGLATSRDGHSQAAFQAPGARTKYRLGNEAETYFELAFDYRYRLQEAQTETAPFVLGYFMASGYAPAGKLEDLRPDTVAQAWLAFANLWGRTRVWLGRRYYYRVDIHLMDYFWLNTGQAAQVGAGVEGLMLGGRELKVALFRLEDPQAPEGGLLNSTSLDVRLSGVRTSPTGAFTFWGHGVLRHANASPRYRPHAGWGLGLWHEQDRLLGLAAKNTLALLYRHGPSISRSIYDARPVREDQGYGLGRARAWELNENLLLEQWGPLALQWALVLRWEDRGLGAGDTVRWYSSGMRPIYFLSEHLSVVLEVGHDVVEDAPQRRRGHLTKTTVALQVGRARGYLARPVLRFFGTGAWWSRSFVGLVGAQPGDAPYGPNTSGWTVGAHLEAWW